MKIAIALLVAGFCGVGAYAQTNQRPGSVSSSQTRVVISDNARFELVSFGQQVIRLDRFTGRTHFQVSGDRRWYPITVRGGLPNEAGNTAPKYQIHSEASSYPLLFNSETGQTWMFNSQSWEPMID